MKIKISYLALIASTLIYSQQIDTQTRDNAGSYGANFKSGFFQSSHPVNYPTTATEEWWHLLDVRHNNPDNVYAMQFAGSFFNQELWFRKTNDDASNSWSRILQEDPSGNVYLKNKENVTDSGIKIRFTSLGDSWYGPYIRSSLDNANGISSRMALKLGSYWEGEKNELTLINGNVGVGTSNPNSTLDVRGNFRVESNGNIFAYTGGADVILKSPSRGNNGNGRAMVHDGGNVLTINYNYDFNGGTRIGKSFLLKEYDGMLQGKFEAKEIKVTQTPTADFVFEDTYNLPTLEEVEKHIKEKKHLPEVASAKEMEKEGVNVGEFQIKLLQKIEELTLYVIEQNKKIDIQNGQIKLQALEIEKLKMIIENYNK